MATNLVFGLLPEHILLGLILLLMLLELLKVDKRAGSALFILSLLSGAAILVMQLKSGFAADIVVNEIRIDRFAEIGRLIIVSCGIILGIYSLSTEAGYKYWMLIASSLLGGMIILDSAGFIPLFMGIEILSLPGFALMVLNSGNTKASEGSIKYLLLSSVASALVLFGLSLLYGSTGTLSISAFTTAIATGGAQNLAANVLILSGFFLKASVFPFHGWAPDAYSSARLPVTAFLASIVKAAVVLGLVRILGNATLTPEAVTVIAALSMLSMFYGNITAIHQSAFKKMLAYSSISHAGYMMFALVDNTGNRTEALLYYVAVYAVTTITACACFSLLSGEDDSLSSLDGVFRKKPVAAILLSLCVLSLAGIPPLPGFLGKFFVFKTVIASGHLMAAVLAFVASYIGTFFYLGVVLRMFRNDAEIVEQPVGANCLCWTWGGALVGTATLALFMILPSIFHWVMVGI
jgi:NADH-quinone oxidoreductase subunit N